MFINKNSIVINGINMGQYLIQVEYQYNKLWAPDSGRNLNGDQSGTLLGTFPKLVMQFRKLTKDELELLVPIFDSARQTVQYYDPYKKDTYTMETYTGDYSVVNRGLVGGTRKNDGFNLSFIAVSRRS